MSVQQNTHTGDRPYLLLVEDSPTSLAVISRHLSEHFDLVSAGDGEEAWQLLLDDPKIEIVITDINMPKLSGLDLLNRIRSYDEPRIASIPVFVMTSADDQDDAEKQEALLRGANDFLNKPINPLVLRARVQVHHKLAISNRRVGEGRHKPENTQFIDPLTGLHNQEGLLELGQNAISLAALDDSSLSLLLLEIDKFQEITVAYGRQTGEVILVSVSDLLQQVVRDVDLIARYADQIFAVLLPGTKPGSTGIVAERIRAGIDRTTIGVANGTVHITASIGLASIPPEPANTIHELLATVEKRLTLAKTLGGNQICLSDSSQQNAS